MVVGAIGLVTSSVVFAISRRPVRSPNRSYDREVTDAQGVATSVHEEVR